MDGCGILLIILTRPNSPVVDLSIGHEKVTRIIQTGKITTKGASLVLVQVFSEASFVYKNDIETQFSNIRYIVAT